MSLIIPLAPSAILRVKGCLIDVRPPQQVSAEVTDIRYFEESGPRELPLDAEAELFRVGSIQFWVYRGQRRERTERRCGAARGIGNIAVFQRGVAQRSRKVVKPVLGTAPDVVGDAPDR